MMSTTTRERPSIVAPALVLVLLATIAPVRLASRSTGVSNEDCLIVAETAPAEHPRSIGMLEQCSERFPADVEILFEIGAAYTATDPRRAEQMYSQCGIRQQISDIAAFYRFSARGSDTTRSATR
jgi:hypothetical protein